MVLSVVAPSGANLFAQSTTQPVEPPAAEAVGEKGKPLDVLATAKKLATTTYAGWTYGNGEQDGTKVIDCTCFIAAVCKQLARESGKPLTGAQTAAIKIANLTDKEKAGLAKLVAEGDRKIRGVVTALVDAGLGKAVEPEDARAGDLVQYWYHAKGDAKNWLGHAAIVESIDKGKATLFGSHKSTLRQRADGKDQLEGNDKVDVSKGGIGSGPEFDLTDASRKVWVVRWTATAAEASAPAKRKAPAKD
ncbi:MAG: hypothetical protein R3F56_10245 [Planctomycetota bacterium]